MQVVAYEPRRDGTASLQIAADGHVESVALQPGRELSYRLGARHCAGTLSGDGHEPCPAPEAPHCPAHTDRWPCARCQGDCDLPIDACREEHAVYLAGFAPDHLKVGVTRSWRLETRLREQGADRAAHLRTVEDGRIARCVERGLALDYGDSVRAATKIAGLHRSLDEAVWDAALAEFDPLETYAFDYGLDLTDKPVAETMASGTVVGTKGRVCCLVTAGTTYAVDLRDLVGHEVEPGAPNRDLQASLGAF